MISGIFMLLYGVFRFAVELGIPLAEDVGVHPSTLRHWQREAVSR